jgi:cytochrome c oxidase cbb3-type subunit 3
VACDFVCHLLSVLHFSFVVGFHSRQKLHTPDERTPFGRRNAFNSTFKNFDLMKRLLLFLFGLSISLTTQAQATANSSIWDDPMTKFYLVVSFIFVVSLLVLLALIYLLRVINILAENTARDRAERSGKPYIPAPSLFEKFWTTINGFVPKEKEATLVMEHDYDGIRELDNHLPPWWKWLFYVCIIWSVFYLLAYHVFNSLPLQTSEYNTEVASADLEMQKLKAANPGAKIDEATVEATTDAKMLENGKSTFLNTCSSCHRKDGGGDIGPNLTDEYWKHGGSIKNIFKVVTNGVPGTNMVAWGSVMSPEAIRNVASYVLTLQGSKPANPKKPEGDLYKPEPKTIKQDSVKKQSSL